MKIEILVSKDYDVTEMGEISQLFKSAGYESEIYNNRMKRTSVEEGIPPAIWLFVTFASAAVLTGFFNKAGEDAWSKLKEIIKKLTKEKNGQDPQIRLHAKTNGREIIIPIVDDPKDREIAFNVLPKFLSENPELNGWIVFHNGEWKRPSELS